MVAVKDPPVPFDPLWHSVQEGTVLFRVHEPTFPNGDSNDGTVFNPGFGRPTRFAFFGDPKVPVLYAASTPKAAVHESLLHDKVPGGVVARKDWTTKVLTAIEVHRELRLVSFHSAGLRRFGITARNLTDTTSLHYPRTVAWAQAAWVAGAEGVAWMSKQYNTSLAVCLFGDRVDPDTDLASLPAHTETRSFLTTSDRDWLAGVCSEMNVAIRP